MQGAPGMGAGPLAQPAVAVAQPAVAVAQPAVAMAQPAPAKRGHAGGTVNQGQPSAGMVVLTAQVPPGSGAGSMITVAGPNGTPMQG